MNRIPQFLAIAAVLAYWPPAAVARQPTGDRITSALQISSGGAVRLDGTIAEDTWRAATPLSAFVQREPLEGAQPSFRTEVRVAYDQESVYVAVRAFDPEPSRVVGHLTRRDGESPSDWIRVSIDSFHDRRTAFEFAINPAGVKQDRYWFNDGNSDVGWDAVWDASASRDELGWSAEFRIPFSQLRFIPRASQQFGFAVTRHVARLNETSTWPQLSKSVAGHVSQFGDLVGLQLARPLKRLELLPHTRVGLALHPRGENPFVNGGEGSAGIGVDLKYALAPGLTLSAAVNPDFGQVEADPAVVNLTAFETFFSERRPFFVEGSEAFRFDLDCGEGDCTGLFYSRRVGRRPQGVDSLPVEEGSFVRAPNESTILGAAKISGRIGQYSIGVLSAVTEPEYASVGNESARVGRLVEPLTSYSIARVRRDFHDQSSIGFAGTLTARRVMERPNLLPQRAATGGIDFDWRFASRFSLKGYCAGSQIVGDSEAIEGVQRDPRHYFQRPDTTHVNLSPDRTSLSGHTGLLRISKIGGQYIRFESDAQFRSPGFDVNDLGFLRRADTRSVSNWIQFRNFTPNKWFKSRTLNLNQFAGWNFAGDRLYSAMNLNAHFTLSSDWQFGGGFTHNADELDDRLTRGGPAGIVDGYRTFSSYIRSDQRKAITVDGFVGGGSSGDGGWFQDINPALTVRPKPAVSISSGIRINRKRVPHQWIEALPHPLGHDYVFGNLKQTTLSITGRLNYAVSPNLSLEMYAEPFVSAGHYADFQALLDGRAKRYEDRWAPTAYDGQPDFNVKSLRATGVLRWEYRPGSTVFVVWQHGRERVDSYGQFRFGPDFHELFGLPGTNMLLVKVGYWLNY